MHEAFQTFDYISEHGNFGWVLRQAGEACVPRPPFPPFAPGAAGCHRLCRA